MSGLEIYRMILDTAETIAFIFLIVGVSKAMKDNNNGNKQND